MLYAHPSMDQAKGILAYIQAKHPDKRYDVDGVMSAIQGGSRDVEGDRGTLFTFFT